MSLQSLALCTPVVANSTQQPTSAAPARIIENFGSCSVPQIEFGASFDNRKEISLVPVDKKSYNHGPAQNTDIISQFMCDTLVNSCGADQTARTTCASAQATADKHTAKTGTQADAFNAVFGVKTNVFAITALDDQGNPVTNSGPVSSSSSSRAFSPQAPNSGKCSTPDIKFATGLEGRKETALAPVY